MFKNIKEILKTYAYLIKIMSKAYGLVIYLYWISWFLLDVLYIANLFVIGNILDQIIKVVQNSNTLFSPFMVKLLVIQLIIWLLQEIFEDIYGYYRQKTALIRQIVIDKVVLKRFTEFPPDLFDNTHFIKLTNKITQNSYEIDYLFKQLIFGFGEFLHLIIILIAVWYFSPTIILLVMLLALVKIFFKTRVGRRIWNIWDSNGLDKIRYLNYSAILYSSSPGIRAEANIFGFLDYLLQKAVYLNKRFLGKILKTEKQRFIYNLISGIIGVVLSMLILLIIIHKIYIGVLSLGMFYTVWSLLGDFRYKLLYFSEEYIATYISDTPLAKAFYEFMHIKSPVKTGHINLENAPISIEFKNVWFKYKGSQNWILQNVSFKINAKEKVAIVGPNGAGKTTIIKLILRIYDPNKGKILINGKNLKDLDINSYYKLIALLTQNFTQANITIKENVLMGDPSKQNLNNKQLINKIDNALEQAGLKNYVYSLKKKHNTPLDRGLPGGIDLSGGQWQKLGMARAFFKNAKFIILDEPTSALDAVSEEKLFTNIFKHAKNKTVLIVSHRFKTILRAHKIIVIDKGKIIEQGTHKDLLKNNGLYSKMWNLQKI